MRYLHKPTNIEAILLVPEGSYTPDEFTDAVRAAQDKTWAELQKRVSAYFKVAG